MKIKILNRKGSLKKKIKARFGFNPNRVAYYKSAFTHRSAREKGKKEADNERLEFLGDSILGAVASEYLFLNFNSESEGNLTELRTKIVNRDFLNQLAKDIGLDMFLIYDQKIDLQPQFPENIYGNALEAFLGAMYLDKGFKITRNFIIKVLEKQVNFSELQETVNNYKGKIYQWAQGIGQELKFEYETKTNKKGTQQFVVNILIEGEIAGRGMSSKKKKAEQKAAKVVYEKISWGF